jgi:hypothetical protein
MRRMRIKSVGAILAVLVGVLTFTAPTAASAAPTAAKSPSNISVYNYSWQDDCLYNDDEYCAFLEVYSTYSSTQIWINGTVACVTSSSAMAISWCGVGGGNGTATLNVGMNVVGAILGQDYEWFRMNIYANGAGCYNWGGGPSPLYNWTSVWDCEVEA